jgi:Family of unknown function (DUF5681)
MANKGPFEVGFGKPPRSTQFKPGQSGNPAGRPRGAKNFATAIEQELDARVTVTENGRRRRISKLEVVAKHLVNKAAGGDLKAIPLLLNEARARESNLSAAEPDQVFDTAQDRKVLDSIIARIRSSLPENVAAPPTAEEDEPERLQRSHEIEE